MYSPEGGAVEIDPCVKVPGGEFVSSVCRLIELESLNINKLTSGWLKGPNKFISVQMRFDAFRLGAVTSF